jgi:hypothetical protein
MLLWDRAAAWLLHFGQEPDRALRLGMLLMILLTATIRNSCPVAASITATVCPGLAAAPGSVADSGRGDEAEGQVLAERPEPGGAEERHAAAVAASPATRALARPATMTSPVTAVMITAPAAQLLWCRDVSRTVMDARPTRHR